MTVSYGFYYDDYHFVRPYSAAEVLAAFYGPWDANGIELPYYRPLTIALYAARFQLLGLNSAAYHLCSLAMFSVAATLFAIFAQRVLQRAIGSVIAVAAFTLHPGMPYSAVAWVTNQMHLAETIVVLAGLLWWFAIRRRAARWWMPLLLFQTAAFMLKEDGIMLLPLIVLLHVARKYLAEPDLPHFPMPFAAAALALLAGLLLLRGSALAGSVGPRLPTFQQAWINVSRGLTGAFRLLPAKRPYQPMASWFVTLVPLVALLLWRRICPEVRFGMAAGIACGAAFVLPCIFLVKAEQLHLVTTGAALLLASAGTGILQACKDHRLLRFAAAAVLLAGFVSLSVVARNIASDFEPFGPTVLRADRIVQEWAAVPVELRDYLHRKANADASSREPVNPAAALSLVAFGLGGVEHSATGIPLRWMTSRSTHLYLARGTRLATVPLRHEIGAFREPAQVRVVADGRVVQQLMFSDDQWHSVTVVLKPRDIPRIGGMHALQIELAHPWVPSQVIPGSTDTRTLGLQVGAIAAR